MLHRTAAKDPDPRLRTPLEARMITSALGIRQNQDLEKAIGRAHVGNGVAPRAMLSELYQLAHVVPGVLAIIFQGRDIHYGLGAGALNKEFHPSGANQVNGLHHVG